MELFSDLYYVTLQDRVPFGSHWCGPADKFEYGKATKVALYEKIPRGDGQTVEVYQTKTPCSFYELRVLPGVNSVGEKQRGYKLATGGGCQVAGKSMVEFAALLAEAIVEGVLTLE